MARLIGERPKHPMEQEMYDYIMKTLPDYIYALFCPKIEYEGSERELDVVLFVPHMGVFVLDYYSGNTMEVSEGRLRFINRTCEYVTFSPKRIKENRLAVEKYLQYKFRIKPFIYEMLWLPQFEISAEARNRSLNEIIGFGRVIDRKDMENYEKFLHKLMVGRIFYDKNPENSQFYDDLTDTMAHNIFFYWETGMPEPWRPAKPPLVFMSHRTLNANMAAEIKQELESRGIFTWKSPEDIGIGGYYKEVETEVIKKCDAFLILLSSSAQESEEVRYEFETAKKFGKKILPLWIEDCEINDYYKEALTQYQYRIMIRPDSQILDEIENEIKVMSTK